MKLRTRLVVLSTSLVIVPLAGLGLVTRAQTSNRLIQQYERRVDALVDVLEADLSRRDQALADRLAAWKRTVAADAPLLRALRSEDPTSLPIVLDAAGRAADL
jgi:hypothetical protein